MVKYKFRLAKSSKDEKDNVFEIDVNPEDTVLDVKEKIMRKLKLLDILDIELIWKD